MSAPPLDITCYERVIFFTGAGLSAASGVPTYRGKGGIWKEYDYQRYACQAAFERDPQAVWEFHNYRRTLVAACQPSLGHRLIAACERQLGQVQVVTQNIDGLHQLAGSEQVAELHGSLWRVRCDECGAEALRREAPLEDTACGCGAWWRPDIVWFGDGLNDDVLASALGALRLCDLLVSIGTSGVVFPAAHLPRLARQAGAALIEINPEPTPLSPIFDHRLRGTADEMLTQLCAKLPELPELPEQEDGQG